MKLKNQVCTKEQAVKLNTLGIEQNSLFYHTQDKTPSNPGAILHGYAQESMPWRITYGKQSVLSTPKVHEEYSAFMVAELRAALRTYASRVTDTGDSAPNNYLTLEKGLDGAFFYAMPTEAQALANLLIWLIEKNKITPSEVNNRLSC